MSADERPHRQVAYRVFSREFNEARYTFQESDDEQAPIYALLPTGAAANRVFVVGTLTERENVGDESEYWRGRVTDPVGTFFVYAGQYQESSMRVLRATEPPAFVAITGKPRTYETDDGAMNVSVRPESIAIVDRPTRQRWVVETAERTLDRIESFEAPGNRYAELARQEYDLGTDPFLQSAIEALESVKEETPGDD